MTPCWLKGRNKGIMPFYFQVTQQIECFLFFVNTKAEWKPKFLMWICRAARQETTLIQNHYESCVRSKSFYSFIKIPAQYICNQLSTVKIIHRDPSKTAIILKFFIHKLDASLQITVHGQNVFKWKIKNQTKASRRCQAWSSFVRARKWIDSWDKTIFLTQSS